jgi:putative SOS response-associated peptidase YedK
VAHNALGGNGGHVFVGAVDAFAAVEPKSERNCVGEVAGIGGRQLVVGEHCASLTGELERIKNIIVGWPRMCNLYSLTKGQAAIRDLFRARHDRCGNLPLFPGIFPDQMAAIVRTDADGERELVMARCGMPGPSSPHWRGWLSARNRCVVPATSFCEYADTKPRNTPIWFALNDDRPLVAFAGLWTTWRGVRGPKSASVEGTHDLFGFLTTEANAVVARTHPKAMPVILTTRAEVDRWLEDDTIGALALQRPLPDDALRIVAEGEKEDRSSELSL